MSGPSIGPIGTFQDMVGQPVEIRTRCHDCGMSLTFSATPEGPGPEARDVMLWLGTRTDDCCKVADSL